MGHSGQEGILKAKEARVGAKTPVEAALPSGPLSGHWAAQLGSTYISLFFLIFILYWSIENKLMVARGKGWGGGIN